MAQAKIATIGKTLVLSDTHLGEAGGAVRVGALRPLWQGFDRLVINGDVAEIHDPAHQPAAARAVLELQQTCEADGVELVLLSGNHDPMLTDHRHLEMGGGEIFITHGDVLHPAIAPWAGDAKRLRELNRDALAQLKAADGGAGSEASETSEASAPLRDRLLAAQHASRITWDDLASQPSPDFVRRMLRSARTVPLALWHWTCMRRDAERFAAEHAPRCRFFLFGHYHRSAVWANGPRVIINTGHFGGFGRPLAVVIEPAMVGVWRIQRGGGVYRLADAPLRHFTRVGASSTASRDAA